MMGCYLSINSHDDNDDKGDDNRDDGDGDNHDDEVVPLPQQL